MFNLGERDAWRSVFSFINKRIMDAFIESILAANSTDLKVLHEQSKALKYRKVGNYSCVINKGVNSILGKEDCDIVAWQQKGVSIYPTLYSSNSVSFDFMGCFMAKFKWKGRWYVSHVHTDDNYRDDRRIEWINFINTEGIYQMKMFYPEASNPNFYQTWGVITKEQNLYSVILDNNYIVSKIFRHIPYGNTKGDYSYIMELPFRVSIDNVDIRSRTYDILRRKYNEFWNRNRSLYWKQTVIDNKLYIIHCK